MACLLSTANADELRRLVEMNVRENNEWWLGGLVGVVVLGIGQLLVEVCVSRMFSCCCVMPRVLGRLLWSTQRRGSGRMHTRRAFAGACSRRRRAGTAVTVPAGLLL